MLNQKCQPQNMSNISPYNVLRFSCLQLHFLISAIAQDILQACEPIFTKVTVKLDDNYLPTCVMVKRCPGYCGATGGESDGRVMKCISTGEFKSIDVEVPLISKTDCKSKSCYITYILSGK